MVDRRDALKLAAGAGLATQIMPALASTGQETTTGQQTTTGQETTTEQGTTLGGPESAGVFLAGLTGGQEVPPVNTDAKGAALFSYNPEENMMGFSLAVQNIENITMAHIHLAPAGENGNVIAWLDPQNAQQPNQISGEYDGVLVSDVIEAGDLVGPAEGATLGELIEAMDNGRVYVNVHTQQNQQGEIRGQLVTVTEMVESLGLGQQATTTAAGTTTEAGGTTTVTEGGEETTAGANQTTTM